MLVGSLEICMHDLFCFFCVRFNDHASLYSTRAQKLRKEESKEMGPNLFRDCSLLMEKEKFPISRANPNQ